MAEFTIITVDVTDDVNATFWEGEFCLKAGDFCHDGRGGGELSSEEAMGRRARPVHYSNEYDETCFYDGKISFFFRVR